MKRISRIVSRHLLHKTAIMGSFSREQISFKDHIRIIENLDMEHATERMLDSFISRNGEDPRDYQIEIARVEPVLFDENYEWNEAIAQGILSGEGQEFPFTVHLTDGDIWTVTLGV